MRALLGGRFPGGKYVSRLGGGGEGGGGYFEWIEIRARVEDIFAEGL